MAAPTFQGAQRPVWRAKPSIWSMKRPASGRAWRPSTSELELTSGYELSAGRRDRPSLEIEVAVRRAGGCARCRTICLLREGHLHAQTASARGEKQKFSSFQALGVARHQADWRPRNRIMDVERIHPIVLASALMIGMTTSRPWDRLRTVLGRSGPLQSRLLWFGCVQSELRGSRTPEL